MNRNLPPSRQILYIEKDKKFSKRTLIYAFLIIVNIFILAGIGFLVYKTLRPTDTTNTQSSDNAILEKVAKLVTIDKTQVPTVSTIGDVDTLKNANAIQAQVYKDAQNGDYMVNVGDTTIIYRDSTNKIVYNGDSPSKILSDTEKKINDRIVTLAKSSNYIASDSTEVPQLSAVTDAILSKSSTSDFYKGVDKNDIIALFGTSQIILIYRSSTDSIFKAGSYQTVITQL